MFTADNKLYVAHSAKGPIYINGEMANRHGLIAGATGTGKTVSLQVLAETFSQAGVPCFMADMKGDLSGISQTGKMSGFIEKRCAEFGIEDPKFAGNPTRFYDVFGEQGFPMRTTVSAMGPQLLSRILELNDTQEGVLNILFRIADEANLLLLDLKDLRMMLDFVGKNAASFTTQYGNISAASVGAIQRAILTLENQGGQQFFGEPAFNVEDLLDTENGKGIMNVLVADKLMLQPKLYSTFLLWLITELYAKMPEVGDVELPKLVFFFDEAHTLFEGTSKALTDKIEQVIRLIRSKGIGIYFVTQAPTDLPDNVLGQLGNRIQHALRAYTPKDQKVVRTVADTFRANPEFKTADVITELATGEALVSFLDEKGAPSVVERARILFPLSQIGAITDGQRMDIQNAAPAKIKEYLAVIDRESAYEILTAQYEEQARQEQKELERQEKEAAKAAKEKEKAAAQKKKSGKGLNRTLMGTLVTAAATTFARSLANSAAKSITTGSKKSTSSSKKSTSSSGKKTSSTGKKTTSSKAGTAVKKATKSAANTVTRTVTNEVLKSILKGL
jgi:hypothetical protein